MEVKRTAKREAAEAEKAAAAEFGMTSLLLDLLGIPPSSAYASSSAEPNLSILLLVT